MKSLTTHNMTFSCFIFKANVTMLLATQPISGMGIKYQYYNNRYLFYCHLIIRSAYHNIHCACVYILRKKEREKEREREMDIEATLHCLHCCCCCRELHHVVAVQLLLWHGGPLGYHDGRSVAMATTFHLP